MTKTITVTNNQNIAFNFSHGGETIFTVPANAQNQRVTINNLEGGGNTPQQVGYADNGNHVLNLHRNGALQHGLNYHISTVDEQINPRRCRIRFLTEFALLAKTVTYR